MSFSNPEPEQIRQLLCSVRNIAVVGLSPNPSRPSFRVASGLQGLGYRIIPVRPRHGGAEHSGAGVAASHLLPQSAGSTSNVSEVQPMVNEVLGEKAYPDLESLPLLPDIVEVFRAPEHVPAIVESCIRLGIRHLWLQEGIVHEEAACRAREAGITVVMDRCMWRDASRFGARPAVS